MRKIYLAIVATAVFSSQSVLADDSMGKMKIKSCDTIAKACQKAGYDRKAKEGMKFWYDCMKPVVMGKVVKGVTIDAEVVKDCRANKITKMKAEIEELESVK